MNVISASYGNDSVAMIQMAHEIGLENVTVAYCDTGWAAPYWTALRVPQGEALATKYGFPTVRIKSIGMRELVRMKKGWPGNGQQFCTAWLKGLPFLQWIDEADPDHKATVIIGKRRAESLARRDTPEFIDASEYHGGRRVWHPLFLHSDDERNALIRRAGFEPLPHRSDECSPCVNSNRADLRRLAGDRATEIALLENEIGQPMFREQRFNALGIQAVVRWAKYSPGQFKPGMEDLFSVEGCGSAFGCESPTGEGAEQSYIPDPASPGDVWPRSGVVTPLVRKLRGVR